MVYLFGGGNKSGTAILTVQDFKDMRAEAIKKYKVLMDVALYSGMRYVELLYFQEHPEIYEDGRIYLPPEACGKKRTIPKRMVHLSDIGRERIEDWISDNERYHFPTHVGFTDTLIRIADRAGLPKKIGGQKIEYSCKMFRKTWESWLVASYPDKVLQVAMSQGHNTVTAMNHYLNIDFSKAEVAEIKKRTSGWME